MNKQEVTKVVFIRTMIENYGGVFMSCSRSEPWVIKKTHHVSQSLDAKINCNKKQKMDQTTDAINKYIKE